MYIILRCNPCSKYMFLCCLVSSLSPIVFYQISIPMFSAGRPPASLPSDMCSPKTENCLVSSSVGGSLSFLVFSSASLCFDSELAARSGYSFSLQVRSFLVNLLPLRQVFPWPAILPPSYPFPAACFYALILLPPSVFGCVSLIAFLGALCFPPSCALPVI